MGLNEGVENSLRLSSFDWCEDEILAERKARAFHKHFQIFLFDIRVSYDQCRHYSGWKATYTSIHCMEIQMFSNRLPSI